MKAIVIMLGFASLALGFVYVTTAPSYLFLLPIPIGIAILILGFCGRPRVGVALGLFLAGAVAPPVMVAYLDRSGAPVQFVLPEGFRGVFQISVDSLQGNDLVKSNGMLMIVVPANGRVVLKDDGFLYRWHSETAIYPNGVFITGEVRDTNVVALRGLDSDDQHNHWMLVGTEREYRIATGNWGPRPLARRLTEDDVPNYGTTNKIFPPSEALP